MTQIQDEQALLPCPFCGSPATTYTSEWFRCSKKICVASLDSVLIGTWNTRPLPALIAAAKGMGVVDIAKLSYELRGIVNRLDLVAWGKDNGVPPEAIEDFLFIGLSYIDFFTSGYYDRAMLTASQEGSNDPL